MKLMMGEELHPFIELKSSLHAKGFSIFSITQVPLRNAVRTVHPYTLTWFSLETRDFGLQSPRNFVEKSLLDSSFPRNISYCFEVKDRPPSLALMPVHPHGHIRTICNSWSCSRGGTGSLWFWYRWRKFSQEISTTRSCSWNPSRILCFQSTL